MRKLKRVFLNNLISLIDQTYPGVNDSGDYSQKSAHASKHGSPILRKTLFQIMDILIKTKPDVAVYWFTGRLLPKRSMEKRSRRGA